MVRGINLPWLGFNFTGIPFGCSKPLIGSFVQITYIENPGIAFGFDIGPKILFSIIRILILILIIFYIIKHRHSDKLTRIALAFVLAGDAGNLVDRTFYGLWFNYAPLFYGRVVDFIRVDFWNFTIFGKTYNSWPIFNVADVSVTIGFLMILIFHKKIFKHKEEKPVLSDGASGTAGHENIDGNTIKEKLNSPQDSGFENSASNKNTCPPGAD